MIFIEGPGPALDVLARIVNLRRAVWGKNPARIQVGHVIYLRLAKDYGMLAATQGLPFPKTLAFQGVVVEDMTCQGWWKEERCKAEP